MDFYEVLRMRRSVRAYDPARPVPEESLERIMKAVQCAPSACNRQPWRFCVITNPELKAKVAAVYGRDWLNPAPAIVVALADYSSCWTRLEGTPSAEIDVGIAMEHLVLAAAREGLGTCWICAFEKAKMNAVLGVEAPWSAEAISPLGFAAPNALRDVHYKSLNELFQVMR